MQVKNINKPTKFKNLTLNKDYEAVEDGEVFIVTNDAGFRARYAKSYFRVNPETIATRNLLDLLTVTYSDGELTISLNRTSRTVELFIEDTAISCGIKQIEGIAALKSRVNEMYAAKVATIIGTKAEMFKFIIDELIASLREESDMMCWLLSDEIRTSDVELDAVLDELADVTSSGINPNSQHNIKLWVIK
jgi:hypothetical protein